MSFTTRRPAALGTLVPGVVTAVLLAPGVARAGYTFVNVAGALPAGSTVTASRAYALNDAGTLLGDYTTSAGTTFFTDTNGTVTPFPTVGGTQLSYYTQQSNGGHLVNNAGNFGANGATNTAEPSDGTPVGGYYNPTTSAFTQFTADTTYQTTTQVATGIQPFAINSSNVVVGQQFFQVNPTASYPSSNTHGVIYNPTTNTTTDIGGAVLSTTAHPVDATTGASVIMGISDGGLIVGQASNGTGTGNTTNFFTGFLGTPGTSGTYTYQDLTPLISTLLATGATLARDLPTDISDNGKYIIGTYSEKLTSGFTQTRSFEITNDSTIVDLGGLGATGSSVASAYSVNDSGQVVGNATTTAATTHAFLYTNGAIADLNTLLPTANVTYTNAQGIDDAGDIVGSDATAGGNANNAYELMSTPEPTSFTLLALGGGVLVGRRRHRRPQARA